LGQQTRPLPLDVLDHQQFLDPDHHHGVGRGER
jgi:hypothetical protein